MSYITQFQVAASGGALNTLTGDSGGAIVPVLNNIDLAGGDLITTVGTAGTITFDLDNGTDGQVIIGGGAAPAWATITSTGSTISFTTGANTLNLETGGSVSVSFPTDSGTATPAAGALTVAGGTNIATSGAGSTVTIDFDGTLPVASGGTGATTLTDGGVLVGSGTAAVTALTVGTNGQVLVGSTAADPVFATLTSADSSILFATGAGTLDLTAGAAVSSSFPTDAGTATPAANALTVAGGTNIATSGAGSTVTINFDGTLPVASGGTGATTLTDNGVLVGSGVGAITPLAVGTNGQVLLGSTGADPVFATLTSTGATITFTPGAGTLNLEAAAAAALIVHTDGADATEAAGAITATGGANITTSGATSVVTFDLDADLTAMDSATFNTGGSLRTNTTDTNTLLLQAYDVDGAAYTTFATLTAANTPTMDLDDSVTKASGYIYRAGGTDVPVTDGGTGVSTLTDGGVLVGSGAASVTALTVGTNGQVLVGSTAADPVFATLTSADSSISFSTGAGTLDLTAGAAISTSFPTDSGTATPAANALTIAGGTNIATSGAGSTVTVSFDGTLPVSSGGTGATTLTDGGVLVGSGTGAITPLSVGTNGQVLVGSSAADPVFATLTSSDSTIDFTTGAGTLSLQTASAIAKSFPTDSGTATPSSGALTVAGGTNLNSSGSGSTVTVTLNTNIASIQSATFLTGGSVRTGTSDTNTLLLQAYDVDGAAYTTFATLTAANTPTMDLDDSVTKASNYIYRAGGTDVPVTDGGSGRSSSTAYAVICGGTTSTAAHQSIAGVGTSGQVLTSNGAAALPTFQDATGGGGGITWNEVTGTSDTMAVDNGYIANNAALVTLTLPTTAAVGKVVRVAGYGAGGWKIAQNASEIIHFLGDDTTTGVGGSLASTTRYDAVELVCTVADTEWVVISSMGNITIV